jgi:hypothetical protein
MRQIHIKTSQKTTRALLMSMKKERFRAMTVRTDKLTITEQTLFKETL